MTQEEKGYILSHYDILDIYTYMHTINIICVKETELTGAEQVLKMLMCSKAFFNVVRWFG